MVRDCVVEALELQGQKGDGWLRQDGKVVVLNMAAPKKPGGAQER